MDMWSCGVTLYCLCNGAALPFTGRDIAELRVKVVSSAPPPARYMSRAARGLCESLLAKRPSQLLMVCWKHVSGQADERRRWRVIALPHCFPYAVI